MQLLPALVRHLQAEGYAAAQERMPASPDRAVAVYGESLGEPGDADGSAVLIHVRGERHTDSAMLDALRIARTLAEFEGPLVPGGPHILRVSPDSRPQSAGNDAAYRPFYALTLRFFERDS